MRVLTEGERQKTKENFWRYRKAVAKHFDDPDSLFPNYYSFGFHDNNQMDWSFAQNSYI